LDLHELIPAHDLPKSGLPGNETMAWISLDTEAEYRRRGGHPLFNETSIEYRLNSYGYRCPEFTEVADIRMISVGCSYTFGEGLPQDALFHEKFAERLRRESGKTVMNWNMARCGWGNDAVERVLHLAVPVLAPHIVLVLFPEMVRREYLAPGIEISFVPALGRHDSAVNAVLARQGRLGHDRDALLENLAGISSQQDDELRFFRSYKSIEALLSNRFWLFGHTDRWRESTHIFKHLAPERYAGYCSGLDLARDCQHPGPYSHAVLFERFWKAFESNRKPDSYRTLDF
jgi:hypothetical protein